jgi:hypothetical protein
MKNLESIIRKNLKQMISEQPSESNYMFFSNLEQIKRQCEMLLEMDPSVIDKIIINGHDWADDHVSEAKNNMDQVFDFFMNETKKNQGGDEINEEESIDEGKNKPTNSKLWSRAKSLAKSKFDVYPSALANGWASKWYKEHGGGWRKKTNESIDESKKNDDVYHKTYTSAINTALEYAEKKGFTYDKEEVAREIGMGPRKPKDGDTNRFTISLKKDDKEQKKSLHIQVYGMKETYELNCYIN